MSSSTMPLSGAVSGAARVWLRLEGLAVFATALVLYHRSADSWVVFLLLFLLPDLSFAGYLAGARIGAILYNAMHSYVGPLLLSIVFIVGGTSTAIPILWCAHIGFDRLLGYGLKYSTGFSDTHLGRIGRARTDYGEDVS